MAVLLVSAAIYTLSKFLNTFFSIQIIVWGTILLYSLSGIALGLFFTKTKVVLTFIITTIVLEISVLILRPHLFQELTVFGFLCFSFISGFFIYKRKSLVIFLWIILIFAAGIFTFKVYPERILTMPVALEKKLLDINIENALLNTNLLTFNHVSPDLKTFLKTKVTLIDFYFADCPPCIIKRRALLKLKEAANDKVQILLIDNGAIDSFTKFTTTHTDNLPIFYDSAGVLIRNLYIKSFPFEIILDKRGQIKFVSLGYAESLDEVYLKRTLEKIKSISND